LTFAILQSSGFSPGLVVRTVETFASDARDTLDLRQVDSDRGGVACRRRWKGTHSMILPNLSNDLLPRWMQVLARSNSPGASCYPASKRQEA